MPEVSEDFDEEKGIFKLFFFQIKMKTVQQPVQFSDQFSSMDLNGTGGLFENMEHIFSCFLCAPM